MTEVDELSRRLEGAFERIHRERMHGIPILNPALTVRAVGLHPRDGKVMGVMITPWFMNLLLLPGAPMGEAGAAEGDGGESWEGRAIGERIAHRFGDEEFTFVVNEVEGIGRCLTHALYSPMQRFESQEDAVDVAEALLARLSRATRNEGREADPEEEALRRFMEGDEGVYRPTEPQPPADSEASEVRTRERLTRRDLLWGSLFGNPPGAS